MKKVKRMIWNGLQIAIVSVATVGCFVILIFEEWIGFLIAVAGEGCLVMIGMFSH
ncbi:MAG: hypothetical protein FWD76_02620 [Firmicutes bacterium]|nr:hypothetical protein [Bacillota bacterium]